MFICLCVFQKMLLKMTAELVGHFSLSWKQKTALWGAQQEHNLPEHALVTECLTRWG